jgi:hypothetical protein
MDQRILWVFKEDVYCRNSATFKTDFWLKLPIPQANESIARSHFELAKAKNLGLALTAFATCEDGLCCSFVVPVDREDAQMLQMNPEYLRYSFVTVNMPVAKVVRSRLLWSFLGMLPWLYRPGNHFVYLESKTALLPGGSQ